MRLQHAVVAGVDMVQNTQKQKAAHEGRHGFAPSPLLVG